MSNSNKCFFFFLPYENHSLFLFLSVEKAVFAHEEIPEHTVYGPLVGILASARQEGSSNRFAIGSKEEGFLDFWLDSDDVSNWMKFVRMDQDPVFNNLIAYQQNREIYFATTRSIQSGEELKVWYSKSYEDDLNAPRLQLSQIPAIKKSESF